MLQVCLIIQLTPAHKCSSNEHGTCLNFLLAFTRDLILDPSSVRSVTDVRHVLAAVASSSSSSRAASFVRDDCKHPSPSQVHTYDSYADLAADPTVDIIYIATPHSHHFQNAMLCLKAGKHVLCEKPVTVNAAQARQLFETARTRNLFFLEGVWTRFFPLTCELRRLVREEKTIGVVKRVFADLAFSPEGLKLSSETGDSGDDLERKHRLVNLDLAGGTLLDCEMFFFLPLYMCSSTVPRLFRWYLHPNMDLPISLSHRATREASSTDRSLFDDQVSTDRVRRDDFYDFDISSCWRTRCCHDKHARKFFMDNTVVKALLVLFPLQPI